MAIANLPTLSKVLSEDGTLSRDWVAWLRTIWQRVSEPWKYHQDRGGEVTLSGGTVVVPNTRVRTVSKIHLTAQNSSVNAGFLSVAIIAETSITITSSNASDDRRIFWEIRESL